MPEFVIPPPDALPPDPVHRRQELLGFPHNYAFVIGINAYPHIDADLRTARPDAERLAYILQTRQGFDHVELLTDATGAQIRDLLYRLRDPEQEPRIHPNDSIVFYYAGHGKAGEFDRGPAGFLLPSDAKPKRGALENDTLVPMEEVFDTLQKIGCHHTLLILDCCFAGKFRYVGSNTRDAVFAPFFMPMYEERFQRYRNKRAWQVLVSAGPDQTAADWLGERETGTEGRHSPFAGALFRALEGAAEIKPPGRNLGDGVLTVQELNLYLWDQVEALTRQHSALKIQYPDLFPMADHQGGQFIFFDPNNRINFAERVERNPYRGLHPYRPADSDLFFGRRGAILELLGALTGTSLILVTAPSGLGKSSVVRAGLAGFLQENKEALKKRGFSGLMGYDEFLEMRPGAHPAQRLAALSVDPMARQILLIDQYEELFTECEDPSEREQFERDLLALYTQAQRGSLRLLLTLRSDFEWQFEASTVGQYLKDEKKDAPTDRESTVRWATDSATGQRTSFYIYRLPPMGLDELREALVNPAWVESYDFESDELIDTILEEVGYAPGALPLLSFTMSELYKLTDKDKRIFTFFGYRNKLGGVSGALSKKADDIFNGLPDDRHRATLRKILLRMVRLSDGEFYRRRVYYVRPQDFIPESDVHLHELNYPNDTDDEMVTLVLNRMEGVTEETSQMEEGRGLLIIRGTDEGRAFIEPVHDSLINFWPTCRRWIDEFGFDHLLLQRQLWQATVEYNQQKERDKRRDTKATAIEREEMRAETLLWDSNPKLREVIQTILELPEKSPEPVDGAEVAFAELERAREVRERTKAAYWLWNNDLEGEKLQRIKNLLDRWEAEAGKSIPAAILDPEQQKIDTEALLQFLLRESDHWLNQSETEFVLLSWQQRNERIEKLKQQRDEAQANLLALRARQILQTDPTLALNLAYIAYRARPNQETSSALQEVASGDYDFYSTAFTYPHAVTLFAFSPDGQYLCTSAGNSVFLWDRTGQSPVRSLEQGALAAVFPTDWGEENRSIFLFDGRKITTWDLNNDTTDTADIKTIQNEILAAAFAPDGRYFLTAGVGGDPVLWDLRGTKQQTYRIPDDLTVEKMIAVAFSPDGAFILVGAANPNRFFLFDRAGNFLRSAPLDGRPDSIAFSTAFFEKGEGEDRGPAFLTAYPRGNRVELWGWEGEQPLQSWEGELHFENKAEWQAHHLGSYGEEGRFPVTFSPDGQTILVGSYDGTGRVYDLQGNSLRSYPNPGSKSWLTAVAFSPDGRDILIGNTQVKLWPNQQQKRRVGSFPGGFGGSIDVVFSPRWGQDGYNQVVAIDGHGPVRIWNKDTEELRILEEANDFEQTQVAFFPDGKRLVVVWSNRTEIAAIDGAASETIEHPGDTPELEVSEDGKRIALFFSSRNERRVLVDAGESQATRTTSQAVAKRYYVSEDVDPALLDQNGYTLQTFDSPSDFGGPAFMSPDNEYVVICNQGGMGAYTDVDIYANVIGQFENGRFHRLTAAERKRHGADWE